MELKPPSARGLSPLVALVLAAVSVLGAAALVARHGGRVDLTAARRNSLAPSTLAVLARIPPAGPRVQLVAVLGGSPVELAAAQQSLGPLLPRMEAASRLVDTRLIDALREPGVAASLGLEHLPAVLVRWQPAGRDVPFEELADGLSEDDIARAIALVLAGEPPTAYLLEGHGELSRHGTSPGGLAAAADLLAHEGLRVRSLLLGGVGTLPGDAALLVLAGPTLPLLPSEIEVLEAHAGRGGGFLILIDADLSLGDGSGEDSPLLAWLRERWGLDVQEGVLADVDALVRGDLTLLSVRPPLTEDGSPLVLDLGDPVVTPVARAVRAVRGADNTPRDSGPWRLLVTGPHAWLESETGSPPAFDPQGGDVPGPHAVALVAQRPGASSPSRLVLVGSARAFSSFHLPEGANAEFLRRSVAWTLRREPLPRPAGRARAASGTVVLAPQTLHRLSMMAALLPAVFALVALAAWWRRRAR